MLTVSLELAKKMGDLGWVKETYFTLYEGDGNGVLMPEGDDLHGYYLGKGCKYYEAPTAQEILDELPTIIDDERRLKLGWIGHFHETKEWSVMIRFYREQVADVAFVNKNFAEALGQLWCWCKENGYLDANHKE